MSSRNLNSIIIRLLVAVMLLVVPAAGHASAPTQKSTTQKSTTQKKSASAKKGAAKSQARKAAPAPAKRAPAKTAAKKNTAKKGGAKKAPPETSADLKRRQEATQKEITLTRQQIEENDAAVRKNLSELNRLGADIDAGKKKVAEATARVGTLQKRIEELSGQIADNESSLERLRAEYLKAIKKMRAKRKTNSTLAFLFSSSDFTQALRRMRYLKQFGAWKDRQTAEIASRVTQLKTQTEQLEANKTAQSKALAVQVKTQEELRGQFARQDALVADLRKNGEALKSHLATKQAEANTLKSRVAALIAEEQRKAEEARLAEERRKAEEARRAEEQRLAREQQARREAQAAEEARLAAAENEKSKAADVAKEETTTLVADATPRKQKKEKKTHVEPEKKKAEKAPSTQYADARKRKPRRPSATETPAPAPSASKATAPAAPAGKTFESMRGQLPRPVSGHFRITGRFGRHSLPDLPDVVYDNPGIDAETAAGASAQAVYGGKVSGVYMIPGFSTVIIVNHGNYYTVYGNIASASVKVGDVVKQGQALGRVDTSEDDPSHGSIHFEVWKNRDKLDPAGWIR